MTHWPSDSDMPGIRVDCPLPPDLTLTFGYPCEARFVAFHIAACTDDLIYDDGANSGTAQTWAFSAFRRHPAVAGLLAGFNFGCTERDADHLLVIDRVASRASVASPEDAAAFPDAQWPPREPVGEEQREAARLTLDDLLDFRGWREEKVDTEGVMRAMEEQRGRVMRMIGFLDMCPDAPGRSR